jgi:predicted CoA-binding protein
VVNRRSPVERPRSSHDIDRSVGVVDTDEVVEKILRTYDTITVVGASNAEHKAAHYVPVHMQEHGWRIVPVNPRGGTIVGERAYERLADVPQPGFVDVFRPSEQAPDIARQAVAAGATALWLQLHIASEEARRIAEDARLLYVEDRCLIIEQRRLRLDAPAA